MHPQKASVTVEELALIFGSDLEWIWAVVLIITGGWVLLQNARQPKLKG